MSALLHYQYARLQHRDEVRLLILAPGRGWDEIHCNLKPARLSMESTPDFEALSYAWGNSSATRFVICDGKKLPITESLHVALRHLRLSDRDRCLWADGVCINQSDERLEKNHQLPLMGRIYSEAERTLIWIGQDSENKAQKAFRQVSIVSSYISSYKKQKGKTVQQFRDHIRCRIGQKDIEKWAIEFMNDIAPIFAKSWFTRLWVVQEVFLAQDAVLMFGNHHIPLERLRRVAKQLNKLDEVNKNQQNIDMVSFRNLVRIGMIRKGVRRLPSIGNERPCPIILELFRFTEGYEFSNDRDRIYALLGMTDNSDFQADYNLSVGETYVRFSKWVLDCSPALSLLSYARGTSDAGSSDIPTWSPSPHMASLPVTLLHVEHFNASGDGNGQDRRTWRPVCVSDELRLKGSIIDSVWKRGDTWINAAPLDLKRNCLKQCANIAQIINSSGNKRYKRFCRAMTLEINAQWSKAPQEQSTLFHRYFQAITSGAERVSVEDEEEVERITALLSTWARCRYFCVTEQDRFAWVPTQARVGDEICIFRNARVPHVIRWHQDGTYVLVGECWIEGLMEGEALELPTFEWKDIVLV